MSWTDYTEAIRSSKPQWNRPVTSQEAIAQQRRLDESVGINNPYLGMSFSELKALGHGNKIIREGFESEGMERPVLEVTCGGVHVTIKRPDIVGNVGKSGGNDGGNVAVMQLTERQRRICHQIAAVADITAK